MQWPGELTNLVLIPSPPPSSFKGPWEMGCNEFREPNSCTKHSMTVQRLSILGEPILLEAVSVEN